eukprot:NODE_27869_length_498_cov_0.711590.p3 GENE.NODE_27869_length_498_cov_0.711590~~NODE_27869_length_498_cov_0.711590.p3  ORF type:complete len:89 (-),score=30.30 NODE_27869_length_498_cov_0.711590:90-356(-)
MRKKLGATLANGNRSGEALKAYNQALDINPGFVRAQYNLGIAYSNLGEHQQAAQYFLRSLEMQKSTSIFCEGKQAVPQVMWDVGRVAL